MNRLLILLCMISLSACNNQRLQTEEESSSLQSKDSVDMILINGNIYTSDSLNPTAEAFVVKDGKYVEIGSNELIQKKYTSDNIIDAQNYPVYSGFFDAHCHFYSLGRFMSQADLTGTKSFAEVLDKLVAYSKNNTSQWLVGRGWDQNDWDVKKFPTKEALDKLFPNTPVYLSRVDGHAALVNSAALKLAKISVNSKIKGGKIEVEKGKLTGILLDNAADSVRNVIPKPSLLEMEQYLLQAQKSCIKYGLTSVDDAGLDREVIELIEKMQKDGSLKMRIYAMVMTDEANKAYYFKKGPYKTDRLSVNAFKVFADGALGSRGAALRKPYSDKKDEKGFLLQDTSYFRKKYEEIYKHGFQACTHCIGDSANHLVLNLYGAILGEGNDRRWRIEHAQVVSSDDINLFGKYNIIPSVQPTHATSDMYWAEDRLGRERIKGAYANQELLKQNGMIALGSDFPVESNNPLLGFYAAVSRKDVKGFPENGFQMENALTRQQALYGMTLWAAYANFQEKELGSISVGKFADFVILDKDIMKVPIEHVVDTKVVGTYINGEKINP